MSPATLAGLSTVIVLLGDLAVALVWLGYPLWATLRARLRPLPAAPPWAAWPMVSIIVAAYNEAPHIAGRLRNLLELYYPAAALEILVSDDGSSDDTAALVAGFAARGVRLLRGAHDGKAAALNRAVQAARGTLLVFTDATNAYEPDTLRQLLAPLADPEVGAVVGAKSVLDTRGVGAGERVYWRFENWLMAQEAHARSTTTGSGEILAVRRACFRPLPEDVMVNDDLYQVLSVLAQGKRVGFAAAARSRDLPAARMREEWKRRNRMTAGRWQTLRQLGPALWRCSPRLWAQVQWHNSLRTCSALAMAMALAASLFRLALLPWATPTTAAALLLGLHGAFYGLVLLVTLTRRLRWRLGWGEAPFFFTAAQAASLAGWWRYARRRQPVCWERAQRAEAPVAGASRPAAAHVPQVSNRSIVSGVAWSYGSFLSGKLIAFLATVVLARLLTPRDFGAVALCLMALTFLEVGSSLGLFSALIYEARDWEQVANVCFWATTSAAVLGLGLCWVGAPWFAAYFRTPLLRPLMRALAPALLLTALGGTHEALLRRNLAFERKLWPDLATAAGKGLASVLFALGGAGAWSLIWGQLLGAGAGLVVLWLAVPWRPAWRWDAIVWRRVLAYGKHIYAMECSGTVLLNLDFITVGRLLGTTALGFYSIGFRISEMALVSVLNVISRVVFPAFSRLQHAPAELERALLNTLRYTLLFAFPFAAALAVLGRDLILALYGPRWLPAIPVLRIMALYAALRSVRHFLGDVYKATGRPQVLSLLTVVWWLLLPPALYFGGRWAGIVGVAWGEVAVQTIMTVAHLVLMVRLLHLRLVIFWHSLAPAVEASVLLAGGMYLLRTVLGNSLPPLARLGIQATGALVLLTLNLAWRHPGVLRGARRAVARLWQPSPATPSEAAAVLLTTGGPEA
ncbi:MAG: oligosaccharide flippase family protein [Terriglobales bacterium]